jgi:uncharacterized protein (TIGR02001 family)
MKLSHQIVMASALLINLPLAQAEEVAGFKLSGNVALTTDYVWRGISQTNEQWALQGGFDAEHESGFSIGTWASNVNYTEDNTVNAEDRANLELDVTVGYSGEMKGISYGVTAARYGYPGVASSLNYDFYEFGLSLGYKLPQGIDLGFAYDFAPEFFGDVDSAHHYKLNAGYSLANGIGFSANIGQQLFSDNNKAGDDYLYYGVSTSYNILGFDASVSYSDTDLEDSDIADRRVFFTLSRSL